MLMRYKGLVLTLISVLGGSFVIAKTDDVSTFVSDEQAAKGAKKTVKAPVRFTDSINKALKGSQGSLIPFVKQNYAGWIKRSVLVGAERTKIKEILVRAAQKAQGEERAVLADIMKKVAEHSSMREHKTELMNEARKLA